jgi:hypothetical protein
MAETRFKSQVTSFQLRDALNGIGGRPACSFCGFTLSVIPQSEESSLCDSEACRGLDQAAVWINYVFAYDRLTQHTCKYINPT